MTIDFIKDTYHNYLLDFRDYNGVHILDCEEFYTFIRALLSERYNEFLKDFNDIGKNI